MTHTGKRLLIIGAYNATYPRNAAVFGVLAKHATVEQVNLLDARHKGLALIKALWQRRHTIDAIFFVQPVQQIVPWFMLARLFVHVPIYLDLFTSIYDTYVGDRQLAGKRSMKAVYYFCLDYLACRAGSVLLFDTQSDKEFFYTTFRVGHHKPFVILPVPADLTFIEGIQKGKRPESFPEQKFIVFFYGYYIPLQGVEYIIDAAAILAQHEDIQFVLVGSGQTFPLVEERAKKQGVNNVTFVPRMSYDELLRHVKHSDVCLGIFGGTDKSLRVVPNKIIDYLACQKLTVTGKSKELARHFVDGHDLLYCDMVNGNNLADKILLAKNEFTRLSALGKNGYQKILDAFSTQTIDQILSQVLH